MSRSIAYNKVLVTVLIDGVAQVELGDEDGSIILTRPDNLATVTVGLDSASTSFNKNPTGTLTVKYRPTSSSLFQIESLNQLQQTELGLLFNISIKTGVNETVVATGCSIASMGEMDEGGPQLKVRTVTYNIENVLVNSL